MRVRVWIGVAHGAHLFALDELVEDPLVARLAIGRRRRRWPRHARPARGASAAGRWHAIVGRRRASHAVAAPRRRAVPRRRAAPVVVARRRSAAVVVVVALAVVVAASVVVLIVPRVPAAAWRQGLVDVVRRPGRPGRVRVTLLLLLKLRRVGRRALLYRLSLALRLISVHGRGPVGPQVVVAVLPVVSILPVVEVVLRWSRETRGM